MKDLGWAQLLENLTVVIQMKVNVGTFKMLFRVVEENFKCL